MGAAVSAALMVGRREGALARPQVAGLAASIWLLVDGTATACVDGRLGRPRDSSQVAGSTAAGVAFCRLAVPRVVRPLGAALVAVVAGRLLGRFLTVSNEDVSVVVRVAGLFL